MLESKRTLWIALAMIMVPFALTALPPEEIWCYGTSCRCCLAPPIDTPFDGTATNQAFSIDLRFEHPVFTKGSSLTFLRAKEGSQVVVELRAVRSALWGGTHLFLKYQVSNTVFTSINIGPIPPTIAGEEIKIVRRLTNGGYGNITVTRDGGLSYTTGSVLMSGQFDVVEQGVLELIGDAHGWVAMTPAEIE